MPFTLPSDYTRIKLVKSFDELVMTRFKDGVNALCWQRSLAGNFSEVAEKVELREGMTTLEDSQLSGLALSADGRAAVELLLSDQQLLREQGLAPILDCIRGYPREEQTETVPTDVYSFHVDSALVEVDTYLCTYTGAPSEGLRNDQAKRRVDIPETRAALLKKFGGADECAFLDYLKENCYDLHYAAEPLAQPFSFGTGNLWRIATQYPGSPVPPCIHRAPETLSDDAPRLLLIS